MKKFLLALALTASCWAQIAWPTEPAPIRVDGETLQATWKDGRPLVDRVKTLHLFHVRTGPEQIDLISLGGRWKISAINIGD